MRPPLLALLLLVAPAGASEAPEISTNLRAAGRHLSLLALDGREDTAFRSDRPARDGDDVRVHLASGTEVRRVEVRTGEADGRQALLHGTLEFSADGENFQVVGVFSNGLAAAAVVGPLREVRVRVTGGSEAPLVLREIQLDTAVPLPPPRLRTRVVTHTRTAPKAERFAREAARLVEEWHPKLWTLFDHPDGPSPHPVVNLYFQNMPGVAHASGDRIHIAEDWVVNKSPQDYGMVVHELFHLVQNYRGGGEGWITEGLADYVRHAWYEPKVRLGPPGDKASYKDAYKTTARFLIWCEEKWPGLAASLNQAMRRRSAPVLEVFTATTGKDVDALWADYVADRAWTFPRPPP
jgi:hypothetical protein